MYQTEICKALLSYYNTSILDNPNLDPTLKKEIYTEATKCANMNPARRGKLERTVLKELIVNHTVNAKPVSPYIAGPYSLSLHWSERYKKLIYIFGEVHNSETDCNHYGEGITGMLIEDYLVQLFTYSDAFIDFYHEYDGYYKTSTYEDPREDKKNIRLYKIWEKIEKCVHKSTRDLPGNNCQKGRMHYIDIRIMQGVEVNNSSAYTSQYYKFYWKLITLSFFSKEKLPIKEDLPSKEDIEKLKMMLNEFFNEKQVIKLLQYLSQIKKYNDEQFFKFFEDEFEHYEKYIKQVNNSYIKKEIKEFIKYKLRNIDRPFISGITHGVPRIETITAKYKNNNDGHISYDFTKKIEEEKQEKEELVELVALVGLLSEDLIEINYLIVDGYLLGRIFRTFVIDPEDINKERPTDEPYEPHNIIIYAGNAHSINYRRFLDRLGFIPISWVGEDWRKVPEHRIKSYQIYRYRPNPTNCIDMTYFPQPFFSNMDKVNWLTVKRERDDDDEDVMNAVNVVVDESKNSYDGMELTIKRETDDDMDVDESKNSDHLPKKIRPNVTIKN